jgi:hypothetical protein
MRGLSLPAIHKHLKVLENAGLVSRRKIERTTYLTLNSRRLRLLPDWAGQCPQLRGSLEVAAGTQVACGARAHCVTLPILNNRVIWGYGVISVHHRSPKSPGSPNPPR